MEPKTIILNELTHVRKDKHWILSPISGFTLQIVHLEYPDVRNLVKGIGGSAFNGGELEQVLKENKGAEMAKLGQDVEGRVDGGI